MQVKNPGAKIIKDGKGKNRYLQLDLKKTDASWYELLEDIIDLIDIEKRKGEETIDFNEFITAENKRRGIKKIAGVDL
jgi:hypothetical protein